MYEYNIRKPASCLLFILLFNFAFTYSDEDNQWQYLFNGKNLEGWKQLGGEAEFHVEDGVIVGTSVLNTPNSFLCTKKMYSDFILELEVLVDTAMNSGIQIRSNSFKDYKNGIVHGYQVEIDPSERAWSGGIYDEGRRGWLYSLENNEPAKKAFRNGEWNKYRIEAIGNSIKTWVNDIPAADLVDNKTAEGFIGLQVHGIGNNKEKENIKVYWRNIRIITESPEKEKKTDTKRIKQINLIPNFSNNREIKEGWKLLWDGKTTEGWRGVHKKSFPEKGWVIEEGALTVLKSEGGGDIVTVDEYSNFELILDFKITEGANSGIKYFVIENYPGHPGSVIGLEYQILDDLNHPDSKNGVGGNRTMASLYDLIPPDSNKKANPVGEWNYVRLLVNGNHAEHWLNGEKVIEYERGTQIFRALVAKSKYHVYENFGEASKGHILLQDHGDKVSFRNIKIRSL